jgi:hypothetical protein
MATSNTAAWGYNVFFNGNPGTIEISGTEAPFTVIRR